MSNKDRYLILETTTGYMDGFYGNYETALSALDSWEKRRPGEQHAVLITPVFFTIPEDRLLADHVHGIIRER